MQIVVLSNASCLVTEF